MFSSNGTVTRIRIPISAICNSGSPSSFASRNMRGMPLPHCSIRFNSWKTRAMTWLRIFERP